MPAAGAFGGHRSDQEQPGSKEIALEGQTNTPFLAPSILVTAPKNAERFFYFFAVSRPEALAFVC